MAKKIKARIPKRRLVYSLVFYYLATILYIAYSFLQTTLFSATIENNVFSVAKYVCLGLFVLSILCAKYTNRQLLIVLWGTLLAIVIFHNSGDTNIIMLMLFLLASMNIHIEAVVNIYFVVALVLTLVTVGASVIGVIDNYAYVVSGSTRLAFGFIYTTDFAAHVFYLCLAFAYIVREKINIIYMLLPAVLSVVVFWFTKAKLDTILMITVTILMAFYRYGNLNFLNKKKWLLGFFPFAMMLVSIICSYFYNANSQVFSKIDTLLTNRLAMGHLALYEYPIKFFGQYISQHGSGGLSFDTGLTTHGANLAYFFIDSSYIKMLLAFGIVFFILYLFGMSRSIFLNLNQHNYLLPILLGIICVSSVIDQHLLEIAYNPFMICVMTAQMSKKGKVAVK